MFNTWTVWQSRLQSLRIQLPLSHWNCHSGIEDSPITTWLMWKRSLSEIWSLACSLMSKLRQTWSVSLPCWQDARKPIPKQLLARFSPSGAGPLRGSWSSLSLFRWIPLLGNIHRRLLEIVSPLHHGTMAWLGQFNNQVTMTNIVVYLAANGVTVHDANDPIWSACSTAQEIFNQIKESRGFDNPSTGALYIYANEAGLLRPIPWWLIWTYPGLGQHTH